MTVADLEGQRVNFVSFTPGTSFDLKRSGGIARERALLYWMLKDAWKLMQKLSHVHSRERLAERDFNGNSISLIRRTNVHHPSSNAEGVRRTVNAR